MTVEGGIPELLRVSKVHLPIMALLISMSFLTQL